MERAQLEKRIENIRFMAKVYGWFLVKHDLHSDMLSFKKQGMRLNVWYTKMTVATALEHPVKGKTQLFRKNVSPALLERLFENPRTHTRKGYTTKREGNYARWV